MRRLSLILVILCLFTTAALGQGKKDESKDKDKFTSSTFSGLKLRSIGPAFTSGRIGDFAVNPNNYSEYYVAVASGNIWKTVNNGTTWKPIFDKYGAYAIGCIVMDPNNPNVLWAGTGENNSQRALGYGDGVYKTVDGGKSWKNMGLKSSRQIGKILIDPTNSDIVYVAAEGSVWGPGGERGLYKTTDGGKTWKAVLEISENTGVSDMVMDPRDPNVLIAASHQRRRHVFTKIDGGPETTIYKTTDGGKNWRKVTTGLPGGDKGAPGLAISPVNPDVVYAIIEAAERSGGFYRSTDRGETWTKMSSHIASSPQYYNEIFCDPQDVDKVYSVETRTQVTEDGGRTWRSLGGSYRHVDDHALWIEPEDTKHILIGGDGGIYESFDGGANWLFKCNLPVTQFYRVTVDNTLPFYYIYGGTQDNNSMGGPSRNTSSSGVVNDEWFITNGGDGFWSRVDPKNPDIVYAESQYGGLVRYDKKSGESLSIKPQPPSGEAYKWNWNAPLIISPHSNTRLYFGANKLFRSEDHGNTWKVLGGDLTRQIDRNKLPVMGKIWPPEAVAKNASTSLYGTIVSLDESQVQEDLVYVGTDDGLIQVTEDDGNTWKKIEKFPDIPEFTYISDVFASKHDANVVFASFDNRKRDDFKPYILKSTNKGGSWKSIANNLPENGTVHTIEQDHVNPDLLFVGTEFGVFFSVNGGEKWIQIKSGIPTISVRDLAIQERENDLVIATFGRGFYILDDYTPLRYVKKETLDKNAHIFPVKDALLFIRSGGKYGQGATYFAAQNPAFGATFTYYFNETIKTKKQLRKEAWKKAEKDKKQVKYPTWDEFRAEDEQESAFLLFTVTDESGNEVRKIKTSTGKGIKRLVWNLRYPSTNPPGSTSREYGDGNGVLAAPGTYNVSMGKVVEGVYTELVSAQEFKVVPLNNTSLPAKDKTELLAFQKEVAELSRIVQGTSRAARDLSEKINLIKVALSNTPGISGEMMKQAKKIEKDLSEIQRKFNGDRTISRRNEAQPPSLNSRIRTLMYSHRSSTSDVTQTQREQFKVVADEFAPLYQELKKIIDVDVKGLEKKLDEAGVPWTPGRLPSWNK
ncbi:WD40/YVTN/BNR-like repeat-containing protein [candidate division KSB1 bacterium]